MGDYVKACNLSDIPPGAIVPIDIGDAHMMIVNTDGALYAVSRICTHETADLSTGFLMGTEVICPLHLSRFDLKTGAVQNPPATIPLTTYKLKTEGTAVYVQVQP